MPHIELTNYNGNVLRHMLAPKEMLPNYVYAYMPVLQSGNCLCTTAHAFLLLGLSLLQKEKFNLIWNLKIISTVLLLFDTGSLIMLLLVLLTGKQ